MKELKITKGEWTSIFRNKHDCGIRSDKGFICLMIMPSHYPNQDVRYDEELEECRHDAELIADAGNTYQKCDLLPSELLQQRDELLEALKEIAECKGAYSMDRLEHATNVIKEAKAIAEAAITKAEER